MMNPHDESWKSGGNIEHLTQVAKLKNVAGPNGHTRAQNVSKWTQMNPMGPMGPNGPKSAPNGTDAGGQVKMGTGI